MHVPALLIAAAVLATAACNSPAESTATLPVVATAAGPVDCGRETLGQPDGAPNPAARECLVSAASAGTPARFISTLRTIEGDLIPVTLEVVGVDQVTVTVDTTQDRFATTRAVTTHQCGGARLVPLPNNPDRQALHVLGCEGLPDPYVLQ